MNSKGRSVLLWIPMILIGICLVIIANSKNILITAGECLLLLGFWYGLMYFMGKKKILDLGIGFNNLVKFIKRV